MLGMDRLSKPLAISAFLLIPATAVGFWAITTNTSFAGDEHAPFAYAISTSGNKAFLGVELEEETEHPEGGARIDRVEPITPPPPADGPGPPSPGPRPCTHEG